MKLVEIDFTTMKSGIRRFLGALIRCSKIITHVTDIVENMPLTPFFRSTHLRDVKIEKKMFIPFSIFTGHLTRF